MWIKEIHIEGFGIFKDLNIADFSKGLNIFTGMNESGKSTLLEFIRRIFFGFPDRRTRRNPYPALKGGRHGGRLVIQSGDGKIYTIERFSEGPEKEKIIDSNGSRTEIGELDRLLSHANEHIYSNVYAFGLSELQDFESLTSDEVKERLYSAGTGTGGRAISELIRGLDKERGELYLPQGSRPDINLLFKRIKEKELELNEVMGNVEKFDQLHAEFKQISKKISEIELKRTDITKSLNHTKNLLSVWEDWRCLRDAEARLSKLPEITNFPEKGKEMLDMNISFIKDIDEEIAKKSEEMEKLNFQTSQLQVNDKLITLKDKILTVQKGQEKYRSDLQDLPILLEKQKQLRAALEESLKEIGSEWNAEKAIKFDVSIPVKEKVRERHHEMQEMDGRIRDLDKEKKSLENRMEDVKKDCDEKRKNIKNLEQTDMKEEDILFQRRLLKNLIIKLPQLLGLEANLQSFKQAGMLKNTVFPRQLILALFVMMLSISGYFVFSAFQKSQKAGFSIILVIILFTAAYYFTSRKRHISEIREKIEESEEKIEEGSYAVPGQILDVNQMRSKVKSFRAEVLKLGEKCGFDQIPSLEMIENMDRDLEDKLEAVRSFREKQKEIEQLENELDQLRSELNRDEDRLKKLRNKYMSFQESWKTWLIDSGLDKGLSPEGVLEIFITIKTIKEQLKSLDSLEEQIRKKELSIKVYEKEITDLMEAVGMGPLSEKNNVLIKLEEISSELDRESKKKRDLDHLVLDREKLKIEQKNLERKKGGKEKAVNLLFKQAQVDSEQAFREMAEFWNERIRLSQEILQCQENIKKISGEGGSYSRFLQELSEATPEVLEVEKGKLETVLSEISDEWDDLKENRGSLKNQIEQMKQEEESSRLRMSYEIKLEELRNRTDIWSVLTLARSVLKKAVENYERERQPEVIKEAQRFFSLMTLGAYSRIYAPLDETTIFVETRKDNVHREIRELSRGTAEQLYLSLRFGFIREFSQKSESLPVIFDDILVNFDPKRGKAASKAVIELAQNHQVIFFTCHPETVKMFEDYKPEIKYVSIGE